jgi:hypothetical protein
MFDVRAPEKLEKLVNSSFIEFAPSVAPSPLVSWLTVSPPPTAPNPSKSGSKE